MANNCAICGAEINVFQSQKLADGNYLCRKTCCKKALKNFDLVHASLPEYKLHAAQVERGTKIWQELFVPRLKSKDKEQKIYSLLSPIYVAPSLGLVALVETRYKFMSFGKSQLACVYRLDDLVCYEKETETKVVNGTQETQYFVHYSFRRADGMADFRVKYNRESECNSVAKYFNNLFGIQKTLGNSINNWNRQTKAIKDIASAVTSAVKNEGDSESKTNSALDSLDAAIYGDRTEFTARADAALAPYNN